MVEAAPQFFHLIQNYPHLIILLTLWITYSYVLFKGGFVSDDIQGIEQYDGTLKYPVDDKDGNSKKDANGNVIKATKICYGTLSKWVRYHLCGGHFPSRHRHKKHDGTESDPIPSGKLPSHHHALSLIAQSIACLLLYQFLAAVTTPTVALLTTLLFIVHPVCVQAVAWPSAIGYILSLICISSSLLISQWTIGQNNHWYFLLGILGVSFFQIWGIYAQAIPISTWAILLFLGQWQMAIVAFVFSILAASINLRGYVKFRKEEFKKQKMAASTSFNIRKPIVALKTIAYYFYLCVFPARMGLYHEWGFHYDKKMELWDWRAISGFALFGMSVYLFIYSPFPEVRLGILWFYSFIFLFLNWITAQQWVTERYVYIPVIGLCLIASYFFQGCLPLYFFIFGVLFCRTLLHLPTYDNELRFYLSNTWNFPKSEVAFGNLGVAYTSIGLGGAASDMWAISGSLNKDYDVPFYNVFSKAKSHALMLIQHGDYEQGMKALAASVPILEKVLSCRVLHFPEMWTKELEELKRMVANPVNFLVGEMYRLQELKRRLLFELSNTSDVKRISEIKPSVDDSENQINRLHQFLNSKGIYMEYNPEKALLNRLTTKENK